MKLDKIALQIVAEKLSKLGLGKDAQYFVDKFAAGQIKYVKEDGTHNHLSEEYDPMNEGNQEVIDAINQIAIYWRRGGKSLWVSIAFILLTIVYRIFRRYMQTPLPEVKVPEVIDND